MEILKRPFGIYQTNCYILQNQEGEILIDPGAGASEWIAQICRNPIAILITHGHYDHIFDLAKLKSLYPALPIYCPKEDHFMLESDCFNTGLTPCRADFLIPCEKKEYTLKLPSQTFRFYHLPGHTPGCSIIETQGHIFSGDFVFKRSIGRYDFPYSSPKDMKESLLRFHHLDFGSDLLIHPGHGEDTTLRAEQSNVLLWIERIT